MRSISMRPVMFLLDRDKIGNFTIVVAKRGNMDFLPEQFPVFFWWFVACRAIAGRPGYRRHGSMRTDWSAPLQEARV